MASSSSGFESLFLLLKQLSENLLLTQVEGELSPTTVHLMGQDFYLFKSMPQNTSMQLTLCARMRAEESMKFS